VYLSPTVFMLEQEPCQTHYSIFRARVRLGSTGTLLAPQHFPCQSPVRASARAREP